MKPQHLEFKLIDNTYAPEDAKAVITSLINDKMRFLSTEMLSIQERFGADTSHIQKRLKELEADRKRLISMLAEYENGNTEIAISCNVKLVCKETAITEA